MHCKVEEHSTHMWMIHPVADTMVGLNGKDYRSKIPAGYLRDGIHPWDTGAQFIATLLQKTGYGYAGK
jgi:hypothetical protein